MAIEHRTVFLTSEQALQDARSLQAAGWKLEGFGINSVRFFRNPNKRTSLRSLVKGSDNSSYIRSNELELPISSLPKAVRDLYKMLRAGISVTRIELQTLVDGICDALGIPTAPVVYDGVETSERSVSTSSKGRTRSRMSEKVHGTYNPTTRTITVYKYTAAKRQLRAVKSVIETLLHELNHHVDTVKLQLVSRHTGGFGRRLGTMKDLLSQE